MTIVVGTTIHAFAMDQKDTWARWLDNALEIITSHGGDVRYFAAIQTDGRGMEPFEPLIEEMHRVGAEFWSFNYDDTRTEVHTLNRLPHITMGQNVVTDFCCRDPRISHQLFLAADTAPPPDVIPKMLEMRHPLCGPFIRTYGFLDDSNGENKPVDKYTDFPVHRGTISAAAIFIARKVFNRIRWRYDADAGMSDDFCYEHDARTLLGIPSYIRMDCVAKHYPEAIGPVEDRGHDMRVVR